MSTLTGGRRILGIAGALLAVSGCRQPDSAPAPSANSADSAPGDAVPPLPGAAATPAAVRFSPTGYALNGTEPFWGGSLTGTRIRYMTPENQFGDEVETVLARAPGRETYSGQLRGRPFVLTVSAGPCSNGMSDHVYAYRAELRVLGETRRGCADPQ